MDMDFDRQITAIQTQLDRLDPQLAPMLEQWLIEQQGHLIRLRDAEGSRTPAPDKED